MARLNRRDFIKALGLGGGVSALSACGLDDNRYYTPVEQLLPYVVKNEVHTPGTPTFFATTVATGPAAFPVTARHREGRVVNVGANTRAPWAPAVPAAALLGLQRHYSPDRYTGPRSREGATWSDVAWDAALERLAGAVRTAAAAGKKVAYLGPYRSGAITRLLSDYTSGNATFWEPLGHEAEALAAEALFGQRALPGYDLSQVRYLLSFGAPFLGTWGNPALASQFATARNPNEGGFVVRFALVAPHKDQTGANADDWLAVTPGSEALVARAIAKLVAAKAGYTGPALALIGDPDINAAASAAGTTALELDGIASQFASAGRGGAVALPGGANGAGQGAVDLAAATYLINLVSGNAGATFGLGAAYTGPIHGLAELEALVTAMNAGEIGVLLLDDVNPVYALPKALGFDAALAKVGTVAALSSHPDETNAAAHLVLPTMSAFEDWGDEEPHAGLYLLRQPTTSTLHDHRALGDVLLATARAAGLAAPGTAVDAEAPVEDAPAGWSPGFAPTSWRAYLEQRWAEDVYPRSGAAEAFADWWHARKMDGFLALDGVGLTAPETLTGAYAWQPAAAFAGDGDLHLVAYAHPILHDGRFANEPWAQETPDPMTGVCWDSFLLVHEEKAKELGLARHDQVQVTTPNGAVVVGVEPYPGIRKDVIALAFGQGHTALGRYAKYGVNVVDLLGVVKGGAGAMAWQQTKARLAKTGAKSEVVSVMGHNRLHGRPLALRVDADELAKVGDAAHPHPGELTGLVHLPRDPRLVKAGQLDFYDAPEHPVYRWALTVDTNACNGCGVCTIACSAENNLPMVGKTLVRRGKEMNWLRINRYWSDEGGQPTATFLPMMCQQCSRAPCESVCPVLATYHNLEGLNAMVYNRCVGTRYCANNCPYQVRRFNFHSYRWPEPFNLQLNPDVTTRTMGVMEKCTFCVQRTRAIKSAVKDQGHAGPVPDAYLRQLPACAEACPSQALTFGNLNDPASAPAQTRQSGRSYDLLSELRTEPGVNYLAKASFHYEGHHHGAHDAGHADAGSDPHHTEPAPHGAGAH